MVKIRITQGKWKDSDTEETLLWEDCPNSECETGELHCPDHMVGAHCPECKTTLIGPRVVRGTSSRIFYHQET